MNKISIDERRNILKKLGYKIYGVYGEVIQPYNHAGKGFHDFDHQHHTWNGKSYSDFNVWSPEGILDKISDEEFNNFIKSTPELEKKAKSDMEEFYKDAEYHLKIKLGLDEAENQNRIEDKIILDSYLKEIKEITYKTDFKSLKFKNYLDNIKKEIDRLNGII